MVWTEHPKVVALRRRSAPVDIVVATLDGFRRHQTGRNGAVLTYYGFLTLFPLFLAATTILGFVLESRPEWREELIGSAVESVPFIGQDLASTGSIGGSYWALVIGLGGALWGSMKAFVGLQGAYDDVWEIPLDDRANLVRKRLRALTGLAVIGGSQVANVTLAALVSEAGLPRVGQILLLLGALAINVAVLGTMYRYLTSADTTWRTVWPGTVFAAVLFTVLQFAGTAITARLLAGAETYGDFAGVLALLGWLSLHAIINLFGAELNAAVAGRRRTS
jgi:membrane protein